MAGYSQRPLAGKLGIKPGHTIALSSAPHGFDRTLGELPGGVTVKTRAGGRADVVVAFFVRSAPLRSRLGRLARMIHPDGGLWIAWPKRASGVATDLTEDLVRELALAGGLVDNKVCAIDDVWSGLRLVDRLADRDRPPR